jgi:hypothetical protein
LLFIITNSILGLAQQQNIPLNREFGLTNQKVFNGFENNVHTSLLPLGNSFINDVSLSDLSKSEEDIYLLNVSKSEKKPRNFFGWMWRSFAYDNLLVVDTGNFYLTVDPLFNLEMGKDSEDTTGNSFSKNTRGAIVRANVGDKFSFETSLYENQMFLPQYQTDYVKATGVVPGQGRVKRFKGNGFDFAASSANLSFTPNKHLNFQLGTGKNFVGDGYRSLLLSDASFNYPFWKIIGTFGKNDKFQYTKLNATLSSVTRRDPGSTGEAVFERKTMSTHYFSWLATKWLNVGLFESTMWQTEDSTGTKPLQWQQFNPIIGLNTLTTGFNDVNHTVVGTNLKFKLPFNAVVYNQFVYDGGSKFGYQIGAKYFGIPNLTLQAEYNNVEPYAYSSDLPLQAYSNYNEAIAHPSGANFNEIVGIVNYKYKRVFTQVKMNLITSNLSGSNIFISENVIIPFAATDIERKLTILQAHVGFMVNPKNNMSLTIGINKRTEEISALNITNETNYVYFGFRTNLRNLYNDF